MQIDTCLRDNATQKIRTFYTLMEANFIQFWII